LVIEANETRSLAITNTSILVANIDEKFKHLSYTDADAKMYRCEMYRSFSQVFESEVRQRMFVTQLSGRGHR